MSTHRTSLAANTVRIVWGGVALILLVVLLASVFLSRGTIEDAETDAQARAVDWANTVLFEALTPEQVRAPILGPDYRELLIVVQAGIRSDDRTARVRLWNADGVLVFSDDQRDKIGEFIATDNPQIETALSGETVSVPTQASVAPKSGLAGADEKLFQTFVPLRLENQLGISGVVQIDQRYEAIESEASDVWQKVRLGLVLALTVVVGLFLLTLRTRPAPAGGAAEPEGAAPTRQDRRALERATKAEDQLRIMASRAEAAEAASAEAEATVSEAVSRLRELEERVERAEERAGNAEAALHDAAQRMTGGEPPRRGVPGVGAVASAGASGDLEDRLRAAEAEREQAAGELGRLRAALAERDAELAIARDGASTGVDEVAKIRALAAEHEQRAAELEQRVADAAKQAVASEMRVAELEGELSAAQDAVAKASSAAKTRKSKEDKKVADELKAAQLQVNDLQMKLAEAQTAAEQATAAAKAAERPAGGADLEAKLAELETQVGALGTAHARTTKELEAARAELAKADAELAASREVLAGRGPEVATSSGAEERAAAVEAALGEMETRVREIESRAKEAESRAKEAETGRSDLAAELERVRAQAAAEPAPAVEAGDVEELRKRIAELEDARRLDVTELQRAQEALANTQFESTQSRRRVKELEEQLKELQGSPEAAPEYAPATPVEEPSSFAARLAHLVREHEPVPAEVLPESEVEEIDESMLSLRERLARAAAARHRAPGAPGSER